MTFKDKKESVLLEDFPKINPQWKDDKIESLFSLLFPLRDELNRQLEALREEGKIGSSLQAKATLTTLKTLIPEEELCEFLWFLK